MLSLSIFSSSQRISVALYEGKLLKKFIEKSSFEFMSFYQVIKSPVNFFMNEFSPKTSSLNFFLSELLRQESSLKKVHEFF